MKRSILILSVLFTVSLASSAQQGPWEEWDPEVVKTANTAKLAAYMTQEEKEVVQLMNLARTNGELFAETFLEHYIGQTGMDRNKYVKSLVEDLKDVSDLPLLHPKKDLHKVAAGHAKMSGETGHVGHKNMQKRFDPLLGTVYFRMAENCSYGYNDPLAIVTQLLVDYGIKSLGHRKNILNPDYNSVGVSIQPHRDYQYNCVMDFGGK